MAARFRADNIKNQFFMIEVILSSLRCQLIHYYNNAMSKSEYYYPTSFKIIPQDRHIVFTSSKPALEYTKVRPKGSESHQLASA